MKIELTEKISFLTFAEILSSMGYLNKQRNFTKRLGAD